jgi:hypothetical protein
MSRNEFDERTDYEEWCDAVDCALRTHRVDSSAFTDSERRAAFNEGYGADECAENFARAYYAALVGYDEPVDYDESVDSFDPDTFDAFIESEDYADGRAS